MKKFCFLLFFCLISLCGYSQVINLEDFESGNLPPTSNGNWIMGASTIFLLNTTTGISPYCTVHNGSRMLEFNAASATDGTTSTLISPVIDWTARAAKATDITFWWYRDDIAQFNTSNYDDEGVAVYLNTIPSATGATVLCTLPRRAGKGIKAGEGITITGTGPGTNTPGWYSYTIYIPNSINSATNYFIFVFTSKAGDNCFMDDIRYTSYPQPGAITTKTNLTFPKTNIGEVSAPLSFSLSNYNISSGSVTIAAPPGFQVSNDNIKWVTTIKRLYSAAALASSKTFVRFCPVINDDYHADISITGGGLKSAVNIGVNGTVPCAGTPIGGNINSTVTSSCMVATPTFSLVNATEADGINYHWQTSNDSSVWTNINGATNSVYTATITATSFFRAIVSCKNSGQFGTSGAMQVKINPNPQAITGNNFVCTGANTTLANTTTGGMWSSENKTKAIVTNSGIVTGIEAGTTIISYIVGNCFTTTTMDIRQVPAPIESTQTSICTYETTNMTDSIENGTWTSNNKTIATVSPTGVVSGVGNGIAIINYSTKCGNAATKSITVNGTAVTVTPLVNNVCACGNIDIKMALAGGEASGYNWAGPGSDFLSNSKNLVISDVSSSHTGVYTFTFTSSLGNCIEKILVPVNVLNHQNVKATVNADTICAGGSTSLTGIYTTNYTYDRIIYNPIAVSSLKQPGVIYNATGSITATVISTTSGIATKGTTDDGFATVALPFSFIWDGVNQNNLYIGVNGYVSFNNGYTDYSPTSTPSTAFPDVINIFFNDMEIFGSNTTPASPGTITYGTYGEAPNRVFVIYYSELNRFSKNTNKLPTSTGTIELFETSNIVEIHVANAVSSGNKVRDIGIQIGKSNWLGTTTHDGSTEISITNQSWRFHKPAYNFSWSPAKMVINPNLTSTSTITLNAAQVFTFTAVDIYGCSAGTSATAVVSINPIPTAKVSNNGPICSGGTVTLTAKPSDDVKLFAWFGLNLDSTTGPSPITTATPTVTTTYSLTVSSGTGPGCSPTKVYTTTVTVNPPPLAVLKNSSPICVGGTVELFADTSGGAISFKWMGPEISEDTIKNPTAKPTETTTYTLTVSKGPEPGCTPTNLYTTTVTVNPTPSVKLSNNGPICNGGSAQITATPVDGTTTYQWTGPGMLTETGDVIMVAPSVTATYSVTVSSGKGAGCSPTKVYTTTVAVKECRFRQ